MIAARQIAFGKGAAKKEEPPAYWWLCFTAEGAWSAVSMRAAGSAPVVTLETSYDGEIWEPFYVGETTISLPKVGDKIYFRAGPGGNTKFADGDYAYNYFSMLGVVAASGNIMSLLDGENMTDALTESYCYQYMFKGCTSLVNAPELPATTLAIYCYQYMFKGCTSLVNAPELPATTLKRYCYSNMFEGCEKVSLISTRQTSFTGCTNWLSGVAQSGIFYCPTSLGTDETIVRGINACPEGWTVINKD